AYYSTTGYGTIAPNPNQSSAFNNNGYVKNQTNTLASSESYLGLQGGWGRIRLGNLSNYMRSSMGALDTFNYDNGADGLGTYSRSSRLLPTTFRYDSPRWGGFSFAGMYSFQNDGSYNLSGVNGNNNFGGGLNGVYSSGIISGGASWTGYNFSVKLGSQVTQQVGTYSNGTSGMYASATGTNAAYPSSYINRLEFGYDDPEAMILGLGFQISDGWGWWGWSNSGGSMNNYVTNPGFNVAGLNTNQYQTQEVALSFGWHLGPWTPKLGYVYGNNMMYNGNMLSIATGTADQIANSGYQQAVAELDWNITPKTIVFLNFGQQWWGSTMQNVTYCGYNCTSGGTSGTAPIPTTVNGNNQAFYNQSSTAIGFTHTF
nr:porin [Burkholderiales bacterium]